MNGGMPQGLLQYIGAFAPRSMPPQNVPPQDVFGLIDHPLLQKRRQAYKGQRGLLDRAPESPEWLPPKPPRFGAQGPVDQKTLEWYIPQLSDKELLNLFGVQSL